MTTIWTAPSTITHARPLELPIMERRQTNRHVAGAPMQRMHLVVERHDLLDALGMTPAFEIRG